MHRPREPPLGTPERAAHGRREAAGRTPGLQTPQVVTYHRSRPRITQLHREGLSERLRLERS